MYSLTSQSGPDKGFAWKIGQDKLVIGRAPNCDVYIGDSLVSRRHCEILANGDRIFLKDLGSSNTTLVNGRPASECTLNPGDEIAVGRAIFLVTTNEHTETHYVKENSPGTTVNVGEDQSHPLGHVTADLVAKAYPNSVTELATLFDVSRRCSRAENIAELMTVLFESMEGYFHPSSMWIGLMQPLGGELAYYAPQVNDFIEMVSPPNEIQRKGKKTLLRREGLNIPVISRKGSVQQLATLLAAPIAFSGYQAGCVMLRLEAESRIPNDNDLRFLIAIAQTSAPYFHSMRQMERLKRDNETLRAVARVSTTIVGDSPVTNQLRATIEKAAMTNLNVLVTGETGTGKELVSHILHEQSARANGPLVIVNCAAIPAHLFESEFFGYEKGAFTGAAQRRIGYVEQANGGTLFLDEVGDLSLDNQAKLLRVIETGRFFRVGGSRETEVNIRVVAATNKDLPQGIRRGVFREDLYHRLSGFTIKIPPLRERREDIPLLAQHFFKLNLGGAKRPISGISESAMKHLQEHSWPGNVRELRNTIERAIALARSEMIEAYDLQSTLGGAELLEVETSTLTLAELERKHIVDTLKRANGRVNDAAQMLGIGRSTLYSKIAEYGLNA